MAAAGVGLVAIAPYLIADPGPVLEALRYSGGPGLGGLTMFLQPALTEAFLAGTPEVPNAAADFAYRRASLFVAAGLALTGAFLLRHRVRPVEAAALVWLTVYVANPNFFLQYLVWGLPFFLMAGWLKEVAVLQAVLLPIAVLTYGAPWERDGVVVVYVALMTAVWLALALTLVRTAMGIARGGSRPLEHPAAA